MTLLSRRSLLAHGLAGAAVLPLIAASARAQGYGTAQTAQTTQGAANQVVIQNMAFNPASLTVAAGTTVIFSNQDGVAHTVTADNGAFDSGTIAPGQAIQLTFPSAATYAYHCSIHPSMRGTITVT